MNQSAVQKDKASVIIFPNGDLRECDEDLDEIAEMFERVYPNFPEGLNSEGVIIDGCIRFDYFFDMWVISVPYKRPTKEQIETLQEVIDWSIAYADGFDLKLEYYYMIRESNYTIEKVQAEYQKTILETDSDEEAEGFKEDSFFYADENFMTTSAEEMIDQMYG